MRGLYELRRIDGNPHRARNQLEDSHDTDVQADLLRTSGIRRNSGLIDVGPGVPHDATRQSTTIRSWHHE